MSELTTAARPYARAAFAYAEENGVVDHWADMLSFCAAVADDEIMQTALDQPTLNRQQKGELFNQVCADKLNDKGKNFVLMLAENDRIALLPDIAVLFHHYQSDAEGAIDAQLISALEVSEQQVQAIAASLTKRLGKKVSLTTQLDQSLIGGAVIRAGDMVIDGSVKGRLEKLANSLSN